MATHGDEVKIQNRQEADSAKAKRKRRLMRALIQWCNETAKHEQSEPYRILSKAALRAIAAKQPEGLAELAAVYGVGEEKAARYGAAVLAVLERDAV